MAVLGRAWRVRVRQLRGAGVTNGGIDLTPHGQPGKLIVICGLDGTGKSTVCDFLAASFAGVGEVVQTGQPTKMLRDIPLFQRYRYEPENRGTVIDDRAITCMFLADRLQHAHEVILPALRRGSWVVCHRYVYNLLAEARAIGIHDPWITGGCNVLPRPDAAIILDADLDEVVARISARDDPKSGFVDRRHHLDNVLTQYRTIADELRIPTLSSSRLPIGTMLEECLGLVRQQIGVAA